MRGHCPAHFSFGRQIPCSGRIFCVGTGDAGVEVPASLRRQFPSEMTIVLQHQFWNLAVDEAGFAAQGGQSPVGVIMPQQQPEFGA